MIIEMLLSGVLVPAIVSLAVMLVLWPARSTTRSGKPLWVPALALALAFLAAWLLTRGTPAWPVPDSASWQPFLAIGGFLLALLVSVQKLPPGTTGFLRAIASLAAVWASTQNLQKYQWKDQAWLWIAGLGLLVFLVWTVWEMLAQRRDGPTAPLLVCLGFTGLAVSALIGETATISQNAGSICAALGAIFLVGLLRPKLDISQAALFVIMPLYACLLVNAHFYADVGIWAALLILAMAPLALLGDSVSRKLPLLPGLVIAALITLLPAGIAIGSQLLDRPAAAVTADDDPYADYYDSFSK